MQESLSMDAVEVMETAERGASRRVKASPLAVRWTASAAQFPSAVRRRGVVLAIGDVAAIVTSVAVAFIVTAFLREALDLPWPSRLLGADTIVSVLIVPSVVILWLSLNWGHYRRVKPFWSEARELLKMLVYAATLVVLWLFVAQVQISRLWFVTAILTMGVVCPLGRLVVKRGLARRGRWFVPLVVAGDRDRVEASVRAVTSDDTLGYRVAARIEIDDERAHGVADLHAELTEALTATSHEFDRPRLLLAFNRYDRLGEQQSLIESVAGRFEHVIVGRPMHGLSAVNAEVLGIDKYDTLFVRMSSGGISPLRRAVKRVLDTLLASAALIVLSPLLAVVAIAVHRDGGSVLFPSPRIGTDGTPFDCYKFRTMREDAETALRQLLSESPEAHREWLAGFKLKHDPRVTRAGALLRRSSLDELPQLWNVIKGDMSLVGPRPIMPEERAAYGTKPTPYEGARPGLTGLWQISGRNDIDYQDRVALNLWYVRNWSLWLDFTILLRTVPAVFGSKGAY